MRLHVAKHNQITLGIVAEPEDVFAHDLKLPLSIEGYGPWISFPHSEPKHGSSGSLGSGKNVRHEFVSQSGPMVRGMHVESLDLDRSLAKDERRYGIEPQL